MYLRFILHRASCSFPKELWIRVSIMCSEWGCFCVKMDCWNSLSHPFQHHQHLTLHSCPYTNYILKYFDLLDIHLPPWAMDNFISCRTLFALLRSCRYLWMIIYISTCLLFVIPLNLSQKLSQGTTFYFWVLPTYSCGRWSIDLMSPFLHIQYFYL